LEASDSVGADGTASEQGNELISLYDSVIGTEDPKEKAKIYTEWAKTKLERDFDISDLSNIELVHLRNTVEQLLPKVIGNEKWFTRAKCRP
jgi:hypothetical protein